MQGIRGEMEPGGAPNSEVANVQMGMEFSKCWAQGSQCHSQVVSLCWGPRPGRAVGGLSFRREQQQPASNQDRFL